MKQLALSEPLFLQGLTDLVTDFLDQQRFIAADNVERTQTALEISGKLIRVDLHRPLSSCALSMCCRI